MINLVIDGRPASEFSDDELVALNQTLGQKVDAINFNRRIINVALASRRVKAQALEHAKVAGLPDVVAEAVANEAVRHYEADNGVHAVAPGATLTTTAAAG